MSATKQNNATTATYVYNGLGEQVKRTVGATVTVFVYDEGGMLLGQYTGTGTPVQQYVWMDTLPVGVISSNTLHYVEADHLGTPRAVIDATRQTAIWSWDLKNEAFGNAAPNVDPDADGTAFNLDLRMPGQRYDQASGLYYNYFRDYDPATGRYTQVDPIGLAGGISTFGYVGGNPMSRTDRLDLVDVALEMYAAGLTDKLPERKLPTHCLSDRAINAWSTASGFAVPTMVVMSETGPGALAGGAIAGVIGFTIGYATYDDESSSGDFIEIQSGTMGAALGPLESGASKGVTLYGGVAGIAAAGVITDRLDSYSYGLPKGYDPYKRQVTKSIGSVSGGAIGGGVVGYLSSGNVTKIAAKGARGGAIGVAADLTVRGTLSATQECGCEGK